MTNTANTLTPFVQPHELSLPKLNPTERNLVWGALNLGVSRQNHLAMLGEEVGEVGNLGVFVSCLYPKQTDSTPRVEGTDYMGMPGVSKHAQFGPLVRVFRRKADKLVRFTLWSIPRQDFCTIIPDGLEGFTFMPLPEHSRDRPKKGD